MKIYFDTEFTGLHKNTTLISIGVVTEKGDTFYAELTDYDKSQIDDWIEENVISNLHLTKSSQATNEYIGDKHFVGMKLNEWLGSFYEPIEVWSDCLHYDWVLFLDLFGTAFDLPSYIYYIPFDLCTAFKLNGVDPDINRETYSNLNTKDKQKHNALWDAKVIKACCDILL